MISMTPAMTQFLDTALADGTPCLVGTATKGGDPQISPKGSVAVFDEKTLSYWERSNRSSIAHIRENPRVVVYYRNPARAPEFAGGALRFHGTARIVESGPQWENAWDKTVPAEQEKDKDRKGVAILIDVDLIELLSGAAVMKRD
jgi:general stress protein 26